jgi:hypothetical protein
LALALLLLLLPDSAVLFHDSSTYVAEPGACVPEACRKGSSNFSADSTGKLASAAVGRDADL